MTTLAETRPAADEQGPIDRFAWAPGPIRPVLAAGAVHVWRADLDAVADEVGELLCSEERARAERFLRERDRQLWSRARGVLRALLGHYLQADARTLRFATGAHGKPALLGDRTAGAGPTEAAPVPAAALSFNLSHSGNLALYALSPRAAVGVDVELARRPIDALAIAARTLGPAEVARLQGLDPATRRLEFLRAWVRHEAELKCRGLGLGDADAALAARRPWIAQLEVASQAAAAVAVEVAPRELRCWDWPMRADAPGG